MAGCSSCNKRRAVAARAASSAEVVNAQDFSQRSPTSPKIRGSNGQYYAITTALTKMKPPSGWGLSVKVKDHIHPITGSLAKDVVASISQLYRDNGITVPDLDIWYNCNIVWLSKISPKHSWTTSEDLIRMAKTEVFNNRPEKLEDPSPKDWGASAWKFLGAYLAQDGNYDGLILWNILQTLESMLDDNFIGCPECAEHFREAKSEITPDIAQYDAARWMFETMNDIHREQGRPEFTWEQVVKIHRWENLSDA